MFIFPERFPLESLGFSYEEMSFYKGSLYTQCFCTRAISVNSIVGCEYPKDDVVARIACNFSKEKAESEPLPLAVKVGGLHFLLDGHHRTTAASVIGVESLLMNVIDIDMEFRSCRQ